MGVTGIVGVWGAGGVSGAIGSMTAGAAGAGAFPPPGTSVGTLVLGHPHMPHKLQRSGTRERHVGLPHSQLRGDSRELARGVSRDPSCGTAAYWDE